MIQWSASNIGKRVSLLGVLALSVWLLTGTPANGQATTASATTSSGITTAITLDVVVTLEKTHQWVPGLKAINFRIYEDGVEQKITSFETEGPKYKIACDSTTSQQGRTSSNLSVKLVDYDGNPLRMQDERHHPLKYNIEVSAFNSDQQHAHAEYGDNAVGKVKESYNSTGTVKHASVGNVGQTLAELQAKYPDADLAARELTTAVYEYSLLKPTQVGSIGVGSGGFSLQQNCMYCGKKIVFLGNMSSYIGVAGSRDLRSQIINVASPDYDPGRTDNPPLAGLGVIALDDTGIVKSDTAKTGLINWTSQITFDDIGRSRTIFLSDITCWVNHGGANWISFSVGRARELNSDGKTFGADVSVAVSLDHDGPNGRVTVRLAGKYAFQPSMKDDTTLVLLPE